MQLQIATNHIGCCSLAHHLDYTTVPPLAAALELLCCSSIVTTCRYSGHVVVVMASSIGTLDENLPTARPRSQR